MKTLTKFSLLLVAAALTISSCKDDTTENVTPTPTTPTTPTEPENNMVTVSEPIKTNTSWTKDKLYTVDGLLYVESGATLEIEAGTVVKFKKNPTNNDPSSALIVARGAKIMAEGTKDAPIIFTAEADDPSTPGEELEKTNVGEWAGIIILGKAPAIKKGSTELNIEGIDTTEERARYGGTEPSDNSGVLKYVSIRYTGIALNGESGNEIQGLTLGGVGSGTVIDYVDVYVSGDDGVEIFGGTVNIKHFSVAFSTDDDFDFDQGYRGKAQFLFSLMDDRSDGSDQAAEWDGAGNASDDPFSAPDVANWTAIGAGQGENSASRILTLREWFAGSIYNSIFADARSTAIRVADRDGDFDPIDNITTARDGYQLKVAGITFSNFGGYDGKDLASLVQAYNDNSKTSNEFLKDDQGNDTTDPNPDYYAPSKDAVVTMLKDANNSNNYVADIIPSIARTATGDLDVVPASTAATVTLPTGLEQVSYRGAFEPGQEPWIAGWSSLAKLGYLKK